MKLTILGTVLLLGIGSLVNDAAAHPLVSRMISRGFSTERTATPATPNNLLYYGGPVLSHVKVYTVFWGQSVDPQVVKGIGSFFEALTKSSMLDWLNQYHTPQQSIARGSFGGSFTITPHNVAAQMTNNDVAAEIEAQVDGGALPIPDADSLYMVYFPKGIVLTLDNGMASCQSWCGDHEGFHSKKYGNIAYAMMPDLSAGTGCDYGCSIGTTTFDSMTVISSHEMTEAVTDPMCPPMGQPNAAPGAWITTDQQEIGDLCVQESLINLSTPAATYAIQQEWDNSKSACSAGPWTL